MKNFLTFLTGLILAIVMVFGGFATTNVFAANDASKYISGAKFLVALHGQDENDEEILMALYERPDGNEIAYINDGHSHVYQSYTAQNATYNGIGSVEKYTVDEFVVNFFMLDGTPFLITDDGRLYACEYMTADEVKQIQSYD